MPFSLLTCFSRLFFIIIFMLTEPSFSEASLAFQRPLSSRYRLLSASFRQAEGGFPSSVDRAVSSLPLRRQPPAKPPAEASSSFSQPERPAFSFFPYIIVSEITPGSRLKMPLVGFQTPVGFLSSFRFRRFCEIAAAAEFRCSFDKF